jgi:hypothetical protein
VQLIPITRARFLQGEALTRDAVKLAGLGEAAYAIPSPVFIVSVLTHGQSLTVRVSPTDSILPAKRLATARLH